MSSKLSRHVNVVKGSGILWDRLQEPRSKALGFGSRLIHMSQSLGWILKDHGICLLWYMMSISTSRVDDVGNKNEHSESAAIKVAGEAKRPVAASACHNWQARMFWPRFARPRDKVASNFVREQQSFSLGADHPPSDHLDF